MNNKILREQYKIEIETLKCDFKKEIDNLNSTLKDYKLLVHMLAEEISDLNHKYNPSKRGNF